jgi:hypothetical protein
MKLEIAGAQLELGDPQGFATLIQVLKIEGASYAHQQAIDLLEKLSGPTFGYRADLSVAQNAGALKAIEEWYAKEGSALKFDAGTGKFHR